MGLLDSKAINEITDNIIKERGNEEDEPIDTIPLRQTVALVGDVFRMIDMLHPIFIRISEETRQTDILERNGRFNQATNKNNRMCNKNTVRPVTKKIIIRKSNSQGRQLCGSSMRNHKTRSK